MSYPIYIVFALMPSIIWLLFYLRKDTHPESNKMILKIFIYGMLSALPAILLEMGILEEIKILNLAPILTSVLSAFLGVALVEEFLKYLVVKEKVLNSSALDEPLDIMLYMIISALGFAALENILVLFSLGPTLFFSKAFAVSIFRFAGATFLHALSSGAFGFFIALSFFYEKRRIYFFSIGLITATLLHGLYNFSIIEIGNGIAFLIPALILFGLAIFTALGFRQLKKIKSVCKIK